MTLPTEISLVIVLVQYNSTTLASVSLCIPKIQVKILCTHLLNHNKQLEALLAISDLPVSTSYSSRGHAMLTRYNLSKLSELKSGGKTLLVGVLFIRRKKR